MIKRLLALLLALAVALGAGAALADRLEYNWDDSVPEDACPRISLEWSESKNSHNRIEFPLPTSARVLFFLTDMAEVAVSDRFIRYEVGNRAAFSYLENYTEITSLGVKDDRVKAYRITKKKVSEDTAPNVEALIDLSKNNREQRCLLVHVRGPLSNPEDYTDALSDVTKALRNEVRRILKHMEQVTLSPEDFPCSSDYDCAVLEAGGFRVRADMISLTDPNKVTTVPVITGYDGETVTGITPTMTLGRGIVCYLVQETRISSGANLYDTGSYKHSGTLTFNETGKRAKYWYNADRYGHINDFLVRGNLGKGEDGKSYFIYTLYRFTNLQGTSGLIADVFMEDLENSAAFDIIWSPSGW
ncbi:MAG: hypothetical protein IKP40_00570 [Clostridia bacterium]|nr:hypothetical protein [Clostridia bacterium]